MRVLAIDYGEKRVGLAISDPTGTIASPYATWARADCTPAAFGKLVHLEGIARLVVGLPLHASGEESQKSAEARTFADHLARELDVPVDLWDERYTTIEAEELLLGAGLTRRKRARRRDKVAAQVILKSYLDAHPEVRSPRQDDDPPASGSTPKLP